MKISKIKFFAVVLVLFVCPLVKAQSAGKTFTLEPNKPIEHEIVPGQPRVYEIKADQGQFLHVVVDQKSVDAAAALFSPDGRRILEVNNPNITRGPEQIFFITTADGTHRLEISSKETGRCETKIESLRPAASSDQNRVDAESAFIEGERLSASSAHSPAAAKYEEALRLRDNPGDRYDEATILYSLGVTHHALGDDEKSADYFRRSLALFQTAGSWDEIFKDLRLLYAMMGGMQETFDYLAGALPLVRALKNQRLEAILLTGIAKVCEDMKRQKDASDYTRQALALFRLTGKRGAEVFTLTEISDSDLSLDDKKRAIDYLNQTLLLSRGASDKALKVSLLMGIGYVYGSIDDHQKALDYFRQTLPLWRELKDKNGEAYTLNFIGTTFFSLGENLFARDYLEQSRALFKEARDARAEAQTLSYLGVIESRSGDVQKATEFHQKALRVFQDTGDQNGEASTLSHLAEMYWTSGDSQKALESYQKSLALWRATSSREGEATALSNIGFVYESLGKSEQALVSYNQALPIFRLLGNQSGEAISLYGAARAMYRRGNLDDALVKIETAINIVESLRVKIASVELRASYLATYQHFYQFYIDLLMRLDQKNPAQGYDARALQTSERARARSLLDVLSEARADVRQSIEPALVERERALQFQLDKKEQELGKPSVKNRAELEKEIKALTARYRELQAEIKIKSPRYAALTQPVGLKEIQNTLDAETLLLEYSLGDEKSYLWVVSNNSIKSFTLPKRLDIEAKARAFYESVKKPQTEQAAKNAAADLSKILIEPVAAELGNKRLLVVADGVLGYIPFAALPVAKTNPEDNEQPLIVNHEIVYTPSAATLAVLREETKNRPPAPKTLSVLADPVFDAGDTRVNRPAGTVINDAVNAPLERATREAGFQKNLPRLPFTRREATTILSLVPNEAERKRAIDFDASRATVTNPELAKYRIVHFATHGLLNSRHPELSGIVLSLVDEKGKPQNGFLRLNEIYNLKLPADLIVLSACQTALGKEIKGEGLIGLTRGFMFAGAKRVVASLWSVDDQATSELMKNFYQGMLGEKKLPPSAALREAQITMWKTKRFSAPYFWSAFTLQGEWK